jgi:hypothetical protein
MSQRYLGGVITANPTAPTLASASGVWTLEQQFQYAQTIQPKIIGNSVRLRASGYFGRTMSASGTTDTFSFWVKRGKLGSAQSIFDTSTGAVSFGIIFNSSDSLEFYDYSVAYRLRLITTQVFRDPSAWYHIVCQLNTTNATSSNRAKVYVNGVEVTAFSTATYPTQNTSLNIATLQPFGIGIVGNIGGQNLDGYLTEFNFVDGQALTPSSFGAYDSTGVWQPMSYAGTYGTNGFYLTFADNSAATATTLGKDYSGNGNNWTPTNISVTAGVTYDWMLDSPTNWIGASGGNGIGNYAVLNPIKTYTANFVISQGNLQATDTSSSTVTASSSLRTPTSGKWYWEITATTMSGILGYICASNESTADSNTGGASGYYRSNGAIGNLTNVVQTSGNSYTSGDVIGVAVDVDNGTVQFYKNNVAQGATPSFTFTTGTVIVPLLATDNSAGTKTFNLNFGQRPFAYTPPTGFKALNTQNLPAVTINNGAQYMAATTYTGNGYPTSGTQTIANTVNGISLQPDLVWIKIRSATGSHVLTDSVRGVNSQLFSNQTAAQETNTDHVTAFTSSGFSLGTGTSGTYPSTNNNGATYVAWQWKAAGSSVSNTSGSITSTVNAGTTQGFSVVTYTGTGANATVGHGLGVAPKMVIVKSRSQPQSWVVWFTSFAGTEYLLLNSTATKGTAANIWNSTVPTSSVFSIGTDVSVNINGATQVAYCFAEVAGYSKFGSYTGNNSTDGPFAYCGFRPRFVLIKDTNTAGYWVIYDSSRGTYNVVAEYLQAQSSAVAVSTYAQLDLLANGFKIRQSNATAGQNNVSGNTYIYMAFAENPFNTARAR